MNVRLSSYAAITVGLALVVGCGAQTVDTSNAVIGSSVAGKSSTIGSSGSAGFGPGNVGAAGANGRAGSGAQGVGGSASGGSNNGGASGFGATGGRIANGGAPPVGPAGNGGSSSGLAGASSGGQTAAGATGASGADSGTAGASSPPIPATWDTVKLVLSGTRPPCNGCHGNLGDGGFHINLNNDSQLFSNLTKTVVKDCGNNPIVTPGDPTKSALIMVLETDCSTNVPRMPPGCTDADGTCVPPEYMTALEQWISNGAPWP